MHYFQMTVDRDAIHWWPYWNGQEGSGQKIRIRGVGWKGQKKRDSSEGQRGCAPKITACPRSTRWRDGVEGNTLAVVEGDLSQAAAALFKGLRKLQIEEILCVKRRNLPANGEILFTVSCMLKHHELQPVSWCAYLNRSAAPSANVIRERRRCRC